MSRVGMGAYRAINSHGDNPAWGLDANKEKIILITNKGIKA
ncbi:MAG: glutathione-regulated potassium-efflux system ancillary protein KefC [Flavobacteriales bacterium]|jgi:glutathione-regulated potassium-efflux system ancillary protein KefC